MSMLYKSVKFSFGCSCRLNHFKFSLPSCCSKCSTCAKFESAGSSSSTLDLSKQISRQQNGFQESVCWFQSPAFDTEPSEHTRDVHALNSSTPLFSFGVSPSSPTPYILPINPRPCVPIDRRITIQWWWKKIADSSDHQVSFCRYVPSAVMDLWKHITAGHP